LTGGGLPAAASEATRRVFFALWPDEGQRAAMVQATARAVGACDGRPVPPANLHVTLCFLGGVPVARVAELGAVARLLAASRAPAAAPVTLDFQRLEHWVRPQLVCALAAAPAPSPATALAQDLARALGERCAAAGFSPDLKPFRAHVTLARKVVKARFDERIRAVRWEFAAFALLESRTLASGPVYSVIESYALVEAQKVRT
jgi:RNA 2',3'-cyclic 3'-phosphodiesterase